MKRIITILLIVFIIYFVFIGNAHAWLSFLAVLLIALALWWHHKDESEESDDGV